MKKILQLLILAFFSVVLFSNYTQAQESKKTNQFTLNYADESNTILTFNLTNYGFDEKQTPRGLAKVVDAPNSSFILEKGAPELKKFTASILIPDLAEMQAIVKSSSYIEIPNIEIAPSKGNLYRNVNPEDIPYEYGIEYTQDKFYPETLVELNEPYVLRDFAGQALQLYPFQYNPIKKVLRVYTELTIEVNVKNAVRTQNPFDRAKPLTSIVKEFGHIYERHFINYRSIESIQYTPLEEYGRMLVISHGPYMAEMQPFVEWKNTIGIPTFMVDVATIGGTNQTQVKNYIQAYYDSTNLAFVLLVGDNMHIQPLLSSSSIQCPSDNYYAYLAGNDRYADVFMGRFSAESTADVQTQVTRTLRYEKAQNIAMTGWFDVAMGVARNEGAGIGHNGGESDCVHMDLIRNKLLTYNYTTVHREYDGSCSGVPNTNASTISNKINQGVSLINYCNHGSPTSWSVANYSASHVNALTNTDKWPFIWSVACVNGEFINKTCFAETWLRATHNNNPTGAMATLMSTINQSWHPPMDAQDEFNDILKETYANNIKRRFGGISFNGMFKMNDINGSGGFAMSDTWTLFGDPSVMIRNQNPQSMTVNHPSSVPMQQTQIQVSCNVNNAFVALSKNGVILGTGTITGGNANITISPLTNNDSITVAVTAYNRIPYLGKIAVQNMLYNTDAGIATIVHPEAQYPCAGISIQPKVVLKNKGINTLNTVRINYKFNNGTVNQYNWTGNLASMANDTITLPPITLTQGTHTYEAFTSLPNNSTDQNTANDGKTKSFQVNNLQIISNFTANSTNFCNAPAPVTFTNLSQNGLTYLWEFGDGATSTLENPTHVYTALGSYTVKLTTYAGACGQAVKTESAYINVGTPAPQVTSGHSCGAGTVTLSATGQGTIKWYADQACNNLVFTGNTFTTPYLSSTTNYYVRSESQANSVYGARPNNSGAGGFFGSASNQHFLIFDAYAAFTLVSVKVYAGSAGNRTISLRSSSGTVIQTTTVYIPAGESRVTLNFNVPMGLNMRLQGDGAPDLFRNNNNTGVYPYTTPGIFSITESSASLPQYNTPGNYYYFYDWEVQQGSCNSAVQTATAQILHNPHASFAHTINGMLVNFNNTSQYGTSYLWNFGDGNTSTQQHPTHTYQSVGTFYALLTVTNSCGVDTITERISTTMAAPVADFYANNVLVQVGAQVNFYDLTANMPNSWHWIFDGGSPGTSSLQNPIVQYNTPGTYFVYLLATNGMGSDVANKPGYITVLATSIDDEDTQNNFVMLHPNPAPQGIFDFVLNLNERTNVTINLFDAIGEHIAVISKDEIYESGQNVRRVNLSYLSSGIYYLRFEHSNTITSKKLLISK